MRPVLFAGIVGGLVAFAAPATAAVVCNNDGECWRTEQRYSYPPEARVEIYEDDWTITDKHRWREAGKGRGYWRGGVWVEF